MRFSGPSRRGDCETTPMTPDYVVVGHCALDRQLDGTLLPGGTALYSALTAARLGMHVGVLTAGEPEVLAAALSPYRDAFELVIIPAAATTTFENVPTPQGRKQTLHVWAGFIRPEMMPDGWQGATVLHLGPIADELPPDAWATALDHSQWPVTTPQGWLRRWDTLPGMIRHVLLALPAALCAHLRVAVISDEEEAVAGAFAREIATHGMSAITHGPGGAELLNMATETHVSAFPTVAVDETGAGDVFAAALFVGLARGEMPATAARMACAAAALSITGRGPSAIPTTAIVRQLLTQ